MDKMNVSHTFDFGSLPPQIALNGRFDDTCSLHLTQRCIEAIYGGRLKIRITKVGPNALISRLTISLGCLSGDIGIFAGDHDAKVLLADGTLGVYKMMLWRNSSVSIGKNTTSNGVRIVCDNSEFVCGVDCMFSDNVLIQTADQHGIVDIELGKIINDYRKAVSVGDHVWLGRQCTLTANANVGSGSVIGTGAIVTGRIPDKVIAAGTPARAIKENHTWSRSPVVLDDFSQRYVDEG